MKVAIDTSVLVAAVVAAHPKHAVARPWLAAGADRERIVCWHGYAETWSVLTAMPLEPRLSGESARTVLERLRRNVRFVAPTQRSYLAAAERCAARGLRSGAIFDALHLVVAEHADAEQLITFNLREFERLSEPTSPAIVAPG